MGTEKKSFELERGSAILFVLMMASNVCNYLFQIVMGRLLTQPGEYSTLNALLSISAITSVFGGIFLMISSRYTAHYHAVADEDKMAGFLYALLKLAALFSLFLVGAGAVFSGLLSRAFRIGSAWLVLLLFVSAALNNVYQVVAGAMQGLKRFVSYGIAGIITVAGKLLLGVLLVYAGARLFGVMAAIFTGVLFALLYGVWSLRGTIRIRIGPAAQRAMPFSEMRGYMLGVTIAQICVSLVSNGDILLVKYFFADREADVYSSAMVIGKISMYVATAIVTAVFPMVAEEQAKKKNTRALFQKAMLYGGGLSIACAAALIVLAEWVMKLLFGEGYAGSARYLPAVSAFVVPLTFLTIIFYYQLARGRTKWFSVSMSIGILAILVAVSVFHETISQMIYTLGAVIAAVAAANLIHIYRVRNTG